MMTMIVQVLAENTVVALAIALVAWLASCAGRPALVHVAWLIVLVKLLTPPLWRVPVWTAAVPDAPVPVQAPVVTDEPSFAHAMPPAEPPAEPAEETILPDLVEQEPPILTSTVLPTIDAVQVAFAIWLAGAAIALLVALVRIARFRRLLSAAWPVDAEVQAEVDALAATLGVTRPPQAMVVSERVSPMLWFAGVGRPRLVLPADLMQTMTAPQRAGVIAHELAHLRRRDHWVRLLEFAVTVLLWFHPLVWIARRGLREAEEQCCDAWAVSVLPAGRRTYADAIVSAIELISSTGRLPVGASGLGHVGSLRRRLTMIVTQSPPKSLSLVGRVVALALLAAVLVAPVLGQAEKSNAGGTASVETVTPAPGESLQGAIDRAAEGATITLGEGVYADAITITKPITLVGAGCDKTTVGPETAGKLTQKQKDDFFKRLEGATDPEQRARIAVEFAVGMQSPSLTVKDAANVTIRGIRFRGPQSGNPGGVNPKETLVLFDNATGATMNGCAVVGPTSNGVSIVNGSDVRIEKSLIAAVWGTGVQVYPGERGQSGAKPAKVHLVESDVRNCHHRCVTISGEGSVVERSRISGSAWHGIRYDHCSPTIKDNLIFGNARFGIYASGNTAARVTGNVFWRNEMEGMGCWFNNVDDVSGNTFVANLRGGIAVLGDAATKLTKNVIAQNPVGVSGGGISGRNNELTGTPKPQLISNVFFGNKQEVQIANETKPLPEGNVVADPLFAAPEKGDFTLAADSPARKLGAGSVTAVGVASPFPITPEETAIIPDGATRDYDKWKKLAAADEASARPAAAAQAGPATAKAESGTAASDKQRERQRQFAKARMRQDNRRFSKDQVAEAEELYQVANKNWRSEEAAKSLKTMIEKFPEMNRTGCAVLYLGQWSGGEQRETYLKRAVEKHSDCYYGNGTQVGGFARYLLGHYYREQGKAAEAQKMFDEIRKNYPEAITHRGDSLVAILREEAKGTTKPNTSTQPTE
jgi:beta-lactamase regulating signal transducer with metallopeptidase domain